MEWRQCLVCYEEDAVAGTSGKGENKMNVEQKQAYEWAKNQNYPSVAARYAKILACVIDKMSGTQNERLTPCDVCRFYPPSSGDGKPCCICPAEGERKQ